MTDLSRRAHERPGYATYTNTAPGDPGHRWRRTTPAPTTTPRPVMPIGEPDDLIDYLAAGGTSRPPSAPQEPAQAPPAPTATPDTAEPISAVVSGPKAAPKPARWWRLITSASRHL